MEEQKRAYEAKADLGSISNVLEKLFNKAEHASVPHAFALALDDPSIRINFENFATIDIYLLEYGDAVIFESDADSDYAYIFYLKTSELAEILAETLNMHLLFADSDTLAEAIDLSTAAPCDKLPADAVKIHIYSNGEEDYWISKTGC